ncbi:unnamed protein product, partial [Musa hybrid cultivar]
MCQPRTSGSHGHVGRTCEGEHTTAATYPPPYPSPREQSGRASTGSETPLINTSLSAAPLLTPKPPPHASIVLVDF